MRISELSIERPVLATVMSIGIILIGALSFTFLPVREYPDIDSPVVSVTTFYRGANPQVVETEITDKLEEQISTIEGIKTMTSSSQEQVSNITIEFNLRRDVDKAANDVRDRVSRVRGDLPSTADEPIVTKQDVNAQPIIWLALFGKNFSTLELSDVAYNVFSEKFQRLNGVGGVVIGGNRKYAMRVWLDPQRLAAYGVTVTDVSNALRGQNAQIPSGRIEGAGREFSVHTRGDLTKPEEFGAIVVAEQEGRLVRLGDVAEVQVGAEDDRNIARYNGLPTVGLGIVKQQKASTVAVAQEVRKSLPAMRDLLPPGMQLEVAYDSATFIEESIHEVIVSLGIAVLLVFVVVFVFLGSLRATLIPAVAIPVSIIGTFTVLFFLGFSINILTLLAFVLAIGLVVDDAIVMLENIDRHLAMGKSRMQAAFDGAREIGFAILATTVTLVAVFVPVAFLTGRVGRLFNEFGASVAVSVLISGFVALTLTPMLCSRILRRTAGHAGAADEDAAAGDGHGDAAHEDVPEQRARGFDRLFARVSAAYEGSVRFAIAHRVVVMIGTVLSLVGIVVLYMGIPMVFPGIPKELTPTEDRGWIFTFMRAPEGATLEYTDRYARLVEATYDRQPAKDRMFTAIGLFGPVTDGFMFVGLKPLGKRPPVEALTQMLFPQLMAIPGVLAFAFPPPGLGGDFGGDVKFVLQAETYDQLAQANALMMAEAQKLGYLINMDTDLQLNKPQLEIDIDRDRAAALGVSVADIGATLQTLLGGRRETRFKRGNHEYEVMLQVPRTDRSSPSIIDGLYVRGSQGLVQLASVTRVHEQVAPRELNHFNRVRSATLSAGLAPGVTIGKALDDLHGVAKRVLPAGVRTDLAGASREFVESSGGLNFLFLVALVFIYLVLAAQFESFIHPLTILFSVPLAVFGALFTLRFGAIIGALLHFPIGGLTLNIFSQIGLIMLIGLVTKNAILVVEFANQRRARGIELVDAVVGAARIRLRPILMTTLATIFGILPLALGLGAGGESRRPLGTAVVGGMVFSTLLTLMVVPVVYTLLAGWAGEPKRVTEEAEAGARGSRREPAAPVVPAGAVTATRGMNPSA